MKKLIALATVTFLLCFTSPVGASTLTEQEPRKCDKQCQLEQWVDNMPVAEKLSFVMFVNDWDVTTAVFVLSFNPFWRWAFATWINATYYPPGQCGGDLPPCYVMMRESSGNIRIWNGGCYAPIGWTGKSPCGVSSSSGKWQFIRSTWANYAGKLNAADASEKEQDDKARQVYGNGAGCSHWGC
jgi:hypothetical protein